MTAVNSRQAEGIAFGQADIATDTIVFRFGDEVFEIPALRAVTLATHNGYFYEAHIDDLRALRKELQNG